MTRTPRRQTLYLADMARALVLIGLAATTHPPRHHRGRPGRGPTRRMGPMYYDALPKFFEKRQK